MAILEEKRKQAIPQGIEYVPYGEGIIPGKKDQGVEHQPRLPRNVEGTVVDDGLEEASNGTLNVVEKTSVGEIKNRDYIEKSDITPTERLDEVVRHLKNEAGVKLSEDNSLKSSVNKLLGLKE